MTLGGGVFRGCSYCCERHISKHNKKKKKKKKKKQKKKKNNNNNNNSIIKNKNKLYQR